MSQFDELSQTSVVGVRTTSSDWLNQFQIREGCRLIESSTNYQLSRFICDRSEQLHEAAASVRSYYEGLNQIDVPAISAYAIEDAILLPYGALIARGKIVKETVFSFPELYLSKLNEFLKDRDFSSIVRTYDTPLLIIEQPGLFNYGHWLTEMFPKIYPFIHEIQSGSLQLCLPREYQHSSILGQTLSHVGVSLEKHVEWTDIAAGDVRGATLARRVIYVSPISSHAKLPGFISPFSVAVINNATDDIWPGQHQNIFVSRRDAGMRFLVNEEEIFDIVEPYGYDIVRTADLTFTEQVSIFKGATNIIGVHGASLTNIVFTGHNTKFMNICPHHIVDQFYWNLAALRNVNYWHTPGKPDDGGDWHRDFYIDPAQFRETFNAFSA